MGYLRSFQFLEIAPSRYLLVYALPLFLGAVGASFVLTKSLAPLVMPGLLYLLPVLVIGVVTAFLVLYPVAHADSRRMAIDLAIPFFMTHLGVLATSNLPRQDIFRMLGERKDYGALAEEIHKIYRMSAQWNMPLPQACRFVGAATASQILSDFLDRIAQTLETGQDLETFLRHEQTVVMKAYSTMYETSNQQVVSLKDTYGSLVMSGVFFAIFAIIAPIITNVEPTQMFTGIFVLFLFIELLLLFLFKFRVPADHLWHRLPISTRMQQMVRLALVASAAASVLLFMILFPFQGLGLPLKASIAFTPLAFAGIFVEVEERRIKRREDNYGAFIRSVGASAASRGGNLREVLRKVRTHDFGPLTRMVHNLYARLSWRIQDLLAWRYFSAETGSHLVSRFNEMFVESIRAGGKGEATGAIINDNIVRILNLRRSRYATAGMIRGLLFGLTASLAFTLFIGVGVLEVLGKLLGTGETDPSLNPISLQFAVDIDLIRNLLFLIILLHAAVGAIMLKLVDGGNLAGGLAYFVAFLWVGVLLGMGSEKVVHMIFGSV